MYLSCTRNLEGKIDLFVSVKSYKLNQTAGTQADQHCLLLNNLIVRNYGISHSKKIELSSLCNYFITFKKYTKIKQQQKRSR